MRGLPILLLASAFAGNAYADCGPNGSPDIVLVSDWSVDVGPDRMGMITAKTSIQITNQNEKAIRMIDGMVLFRDALGGYIANIGIERDLFIAANGAASWSAEYGGTDLDRIPNLRRDEVAVHACVDSVLYDDGSVERFDE